MKMLAMSVLGLSLLGGGSFLATNGQPVNPNRPDCPGQIKCPRTGEWICEDRCPVLEEKTDGADAQPVATCAMCR
jgi:uncharacterized protein (UPF0305 family)